MGSKVLKVVCHCYWFITTYGRGMTQKSRNRGKTGAQKKVTFMVRYFLGFFRNSVMNSRKLLAASVRLS